jgi:hypothetical protein
MQPELCRIENVSDEVVDDAFTCLLASFGKVHAL